MKPLLSALIALVLLGLPQQAVAQETTDLQSLDQEYAARSWRAVGRIDLGGRGTCSGTLIAKDLVLTAAHCLYRDGTTTLYEPQQVIFRAGLRDGKAVATRRAEAIAAHQSFDPLGHLSAENIRYDVGLIRLEEPISSFDVPSFSIHRDVVEPGPVSIVSYGRGRNNTQSRQKVCHMLDTLSEVYIFDCKADPGTSGAPVFSHLNGRGAILAVISGRFRDENVERSVGMALPKRVDEVKRQLRIQVRGPLAQARSVRVGEGASGSAKFVRPQTP